MWKKVSIGQLFSCTPGFPGRNTSSPPRTTIALPECNSMSTPSLRLICGASLQTDCGRAFAISLRQGVTTSKSCQPTGLRHGSSGCGPSSASVFRRFRRDSSHHTVARGVDTVTSPRFVRERLRAGRKSQRASTDVRHAPSVSGQDVGIDGIRRADHSEHGKHERHPLRRSPALPTNHDDGRKRCQPGERQPSLKLRGVPGQHPH